MKIHQKFVYILVQLSKSYKHLTELTSPCEFLPQPWSCLCRLKCEYYASLAHGYSADGVAKKGKATTILVDCMLKQNDSLLDSAREQHAAILSMCLFLSIL